MMRLLVTGQLYGDPQPRTSQAGKPFTTAKLRADGKDGSAVWCSLVAFGEQAERLATMKANNAVAVSGKLEVNAYTSKAGEPAAGLSVVIDELATLKPKPKPKPESAPVPVRPATAPIPFEYPESKQGKKDKATSDLESDVFSGKSLQRARFVLRNCRDKAEEVSQL